MTHLGLFEGIGGFSLAARWMGWETVAWCEWNDFGQRVLRHHFPEAIGHGDITQTDFTPYANRIDILTGGFPCQPYSMAGKRRGKDDDRHLWPQMCRAIREIAPRYIVGENVLGLVNWNGGLVFDEVCSDLEAQGYEVTPVVIPAAAVNAPHGRDRVWFVAYSERNRKESDRCSIADERGRKASLFQENKGWESKAIQSDRLCSLSWYAPDTNSDGQHQRHSGYEINASEGRINAQCDVEQGNDDGNVADTASFGLERECRPIRELERRFRFGSPNTRNFQHSAWQNFPTQPPICGGDDGLPRQLDGITFSKWRAESIKAYGNAIVPQVAYEIFKAIAAYESQPLP